MQRHQNANKSQLKPIGKPFIPPGLLSNTPIDLIHFQKRLILARIFDLYKVFNLTKLPFCRSLK